MNSLTTRTAKEVRLMFWPWCLVTGIGALLWFVPSYYPTATFMTLGFHLGIPLLAVFPFGLEFQQGTLPLLLSQPAARMRIWGEKLLVTFAAILLATLVFGVGIEEHTGLWILVSISSATFFTLIARSTIGGATLILFQIFVIHLGEIFVESMFDQPLPFKVVLGVGYSALMFWLSWRELQHFQLAGGSERGDLLMVRAVPLAFRYSASPTLNVIRKEVRFLQPLAIITVFFVLTCVSLSIGLRLAPPPTSGFSLATILAVLVLGVYPVLIPVLAGSLALGEERAWGIQRWHLTLPMSALQQWFLKFVVAAVAGLILGVLIPLLVVLASQSIAGPVLTASLGLNLASLNVDFLLWAAMSVLLLTIASFWCACAGESTMRAALSALLIGTVLMMFDLAPRVVGVADYLQHHGPPVLIVLMQSYWLFCSPPPDRLYLLTRYILPLAVFTRVWFFFV